MRTLLADVAPSVNSTQASLLCGDKSNIRQKSHLTTITTVDVKSAFHYIDEFVRAKQKQKFSNVIG
jgi:hypothetical protein